MSELVKISEDAFCISNLLTEDECMDLIQKTENIGYAESTITSDGKQIVSKEIRNNERVIIDDHELSNLLWTKIKPFVPFVLDGCNVIGLNERFRFYRYNHNQMFRLHRDFPFEREGEASKLSIIIYLNQDFEGGETDFRDFKVEPKIGMALIFRHELLHEGCAVKSGRKYAVRTDIMYTKSD